MMIVRIGSSLRLAETWLTRFQPALSEGELGRPVPLRNRLLIALGITVISSLLCWRVLERFGFGGGDFGWAMRAAFDLLAGRDPYDYPFNSYAIPYPLTAAFWGLPFIGFSPELGGGLFFGLSSGLLAFGLTRFGYRRLLIFLSYPYFAALVAAQWSPLLMAAGFFPLLFPVILAKPHIGLVIFFNYLTRLGFWLCVMLGILSLSLMPDWPWRWLSQTGEFQNFFPVLLLPGPLLLLALLDHKRRDARLLLMAALIPQRWFYDNFILWLIPKSTREILLTCVISWSIGVWRWSIGVPDNITQVGRMSVLFVYLPMLGIILWRWGMRRRRLL